MDRLISEKAVLNAIYNSYGALEAINSIRAIPSAEPKEVMYSGDGYADGEMVYDIANCPNCDYEFEYSDFIWGCKFCPECGQALKWEGEQDETDN